MKTAKLTINDKINLKSIVQNRMGYLPLQKINAIKTDGDVFVKINGVDSGFISYVKSLGYSILN